jgi:DNA-directed RNA polymerase specialized sigma24 family protein
MDDSVEITAQLARLSQGDTEAAEEAARIVWEKYFPQLVREARRRLDGVPPRFVDDEDVAQSAIKSFFRGLEGHRFPRLDDGDCLWRLLATILARKALRARHNYFSPQNGGGRVRGDSIWAEPGNSSPGVGFDRLSTEDPTPDLFVVLADTLHFLLDALPGDRYRQILLLRMEGYTTAQTAKKFGVSMSNIEGKLRTIRATWAKLQQKVF